MIGLRGWVAATALAAGIAGGIASPALAQDADAKAILMKSINFRTVPGPDSQAVAYGEYLAGLLTAAGIPASDIEVKKREETATLVARWRGTSSTLKPIILSGHMDVVEAKREDWERDPCVAVEENGYVFGRGALDNKLGLSTMVAAIIDLKKAGFKPGRDIILALSGDEETFMVTTQALAQELKGAEMVLNSDAGGALLDETTGKQLVYGLQAGEKTYADFELTFTDPGGHSSRPGATNPIYSLSRSLDRISGYTFPVLQNELTKAYFTAAAAQTGGPIGDAMRRFAANPQDQAVVATLRADPEYVGQIGTTCVATMLSGGHAPNALAQRATATINCRIFPGTSVASVQAKLAEVAADPKLTIRKIEAGAVESDASPLRADVMAAVRKAVDSYSKGLPIVPQMSAGATDGMHFRAVGIPSYGVGGNFLKSSDDFSHGLNERVPVATIAPAVTMWKILLRDLAK